MGDVALMRQLVGTGTLSRLARELQLEDELKVIPLWPCTGVLIVAPERVESSDDDGLHVDEGGLRSMVSEMEQQLRSLAQYIDYVHAVLHVCRYHRQTSRNGRDADMYWCTSFLYHLYVCCAVDECIVVPLFYQAHTIS